MTKPCSKRLPDRLAADLDEALQENLHYRYCRDLGQLAPAEVLQVPRDGYRRYVERCRSRGQRIGDIKACALSPASGWEEALQAPFSSFPRKLPGSPADKPPRGKSEKV